MDLRNEGRQPEPRPAVAAHAAVVDPVQSDLARRILTILLIVLSLLGILALASQALAKTMPDRAVKQKQYQALFLTNGQVYFGKLSNTNADYVKLKDIYYLQVQQQVQPKDNKAPTDQPQISLAKLGSELHGPEDTMYVDRHQVLFWENLKEDGKVVAAIKDFQRTNKK